MEHDYIKEQGIIEKYVLRKLGKEEELAFGKHLFFCEDCRKELEKTKAFVSIVRFAAIENKHKKNQSLYEEQAKEKIKIVPLFYKLAVPAAVLFLISTAFVIFYKFGKPAADNTSISLLNLKEENDSIINAIRFKEKKIAERDSIISELKNESKNNQDASTDYENAAALPDVISASDNVRGEYNRSDYINLGYSIFIKKGEKINFRINEGANSGYSFFIINCKKDTLLKTSGAGKNKISMIIKQPVYWRLITSEAGEKKLFDGKILIRKQTSLKIQ